MILTRKKDFLDEFAKITYTLSYIKGATTLAGVWSNFFTKARNTNNDWRKYTWKVETRFTSIHDKISLDFKEFNKQADTRTNWLG